MLIPALVLSWCGAALPAESDADVTRAVLAMERQSMEGWLKGDSGPMLAAADAEITYFHMMTEKRLEGVAALKALYDGYRGRPLFDSYEIAEPKVQVSGAVALLTYQLVTRNGSLTRRWNATLVYRRNQEGWRVIHSHFSQVQGGQ
jgi:hypothetical protein